MTARPIIDGITFYGFSFIKQGHFEAFGKDRWRQGIIGHDAIPTWATAVHMNKDELARVVDHLEPDGTRIPPDSTLREEARGSKSEAHTALVNPASHRGAA